MTVSSTTRKLTYTGTGTVGPFAYTFRIFSDSDLAVTTTDLAGADVVLVLDVDYTVTGTGAFAGGSITLTSALTTGWTLTVERTLPLTQLTSLRNQGAYYPETIEDTFDRSRMIDQQLAGEDVILAAAIAVVEGDVVSIQSAISVIEGDIVTIEADIVTIEGNISSIQGDITAMQGDITTLQGNIVTINARLDALELALAAVLLRLDAIEAALALLLTTPMTHEGDMIYGGTAGVVTRLPYRPQAEGPKFLITRYGYPEWAQLVFEEYAQAGTPGDMLYAAAVTGTWTRLPIGNELDVLTVTDGVPSWGPIA